MLVWLSVAVLALWTRLSDMPLVEFKYDEARVAELTDLWVHHGQVPATSIVTSAGVQNSPLSIYLLAPAALVSWRPEVLTGAIALLNVIAVLLTTAMVSRFWGAQAGALCGLLYATAPMATQYSRKIWAPELMPLFSVLCIWSLLLTFERRRPWMLVPAVAAWSALVQLHQAAIWLAPLFVVISVYRFRCLRPLPVVVAIVAALAVAAPYLRYEAAHTWADVLSLIALAGKPGTVSGLSWWYAWALGAGWGLTSFLGMPEYVLRPASTSRNWLDVLVLVLYVVGIMRVALVFTQRQERTCMPGRAAAAIVLLWALLPPFGLMRSAVPVFPHYLIFWYPAPFMVAALGIDWIARFATPPVRTRVPASTSTLSGMGITVARRETDAPVMPPILPGAPALNKGQGWQASRGAWLGPLLATALLGATVSGNLARIVNFREEIRSRHGGGEYGMPLGDSERLVMETQIPGTRRYVSDRGDLPAVYRYLDRTRDAAFVEPDFALVVPSSAHPALYISDRDTYRSLDTLRTLTSTTRVTSPGTTVVRALPAGAPLRIPVGPRYTTGAGLALTGWAGDAVLSGGQPYHVTLWWEVTATGQAPPGELKVFTHLLDSQRKTVAQHDALGYVPRYWMVGERVATFFTLPLPAALPTGSYQLVAGLYTLPGAQGIPVTGPAGEALGTEIPITTLSVTAQ